MPIETGKIIIETPYGLPNRYSIHVKDEFGVCSQPEFNFSNRMVSFRLTQKLNGVWSLKATIMGVTGPDLNYLKRGNTVKFFIENNNWFVGHIVSAPLANNRIEIDSVGKVSWTLANDNMDRVEYTSTAFSTVNSNIVSGSGVSMNVNENYGNVNIRYDYDDKLTAIQQNAGNVDYDWYESWGSYPYDSLCMNVESSKGSETPVYTFSRTGAGANIIESKKKQDETELLNYVTAMGFGDGDLQLTSICFHATTARTILSSDLSAAATTASLADASDFPSSGSVWIGCEKVSYSGKSGNNLTGCTRGVAFLGNISQAYQHDSGIAVYDAQYTTSLPQSESSVSDNGLIKGRSINRNIVNQNALDLLAQKIIDKFSSVPEYITLKPKNPKNVLGYVSLGDHVSITDELSDIDGNYRVVSIVLEQKEGKEVLSLECSNAGKDIYDTIEILNKNIDKESSHLQGAPTYIPLHLFENADDANYGIIRAYIPSEITAIKKAELRFILTDFRAYTDVTQTASTANHTHEIGASGSHTHGVPSHIHGIGTLDLDWSDYVGTSTDVGSTSAGTGGVTTDSQAHTHSIGASGGHTHSITTSFGIYEEALSSPSVDVYMGIFGESMSKINSSAFTSVDTLITLDITDTLKSLVLPSSGKYVEIQFRCNKNMRIECSGYILGQLKP